MLGYTYTAYLFSLSKEREQSVSHNAP